MTTPADPTNPADPTDPLENAIPSARRTSRPSAGEGLSAGSAQAPDFAPSSLFADDDCPRSPFSSVKRGLRQGLALARAVRPVGWAFILWGAVLEAVCFSAWAQGAELSGFDQRFVFPVLAFISTVVPLGLVKCRRDAEIRVEIASRKWRLPDEAPRWGWRTVLGDALLLLGITGGAAMPAGEYVPILAAVVSIAIGLGLLCRSATAAPATVGDVRRQSARTHRFYDLGATGFRSGERAFWRTRVRVDRAERAAQTQGEENEEKKTEEAAEKPEGKREEKAASETDASSHTCEAREADEAGETNETTEARKTDETDDADETAASRPHPSKRSPWIQVDDYDLWVTNWGLHARSLTGGTDWSCARDEILRAKRVTDRANEIWFLIPGGSFVLGFPTPLDLLIFGRAWGLMASPDLVIDPVTGQVRAGAKGTPGASGSPDAFGVNTSWTPTVSGAAGSAAVGMAGAAAAAGAGLAAGAASAQSAGLNAPDGLGRIEPTLFPPEEVFPAFPDASGDFIPTEEVGNPVFGNAWEEEQVFGAGVPDPGNFFGFSGPREDDFSASGSEDEDVFRWDDPDPWNPTDGMHPMSAMAGMGGMSAMSGTDLTTEPDDPDDPWPDLDWSDNPFTQDAYAFDTLESTGWEDSGGFDGSVFSDEW